MHKIILKFLFSLTLITLILPMSFSLADDSDKSRSPFGKPQPPVANKTVVQYQPIDGKMKYGTVTKVYPNGSFSVDGSKKTKFFYSDDIRNSVRPLQVLKTADRPKAIVMSDENLKKAKYAKVYTVRRHFTGGVVELLDGRLIETKASNVAVIKKGDNIRHALTPLKRAAVPSLGAAKLAQKRLRGRITPILITEYDNAKTSSDIAQRFAKKKTGANLTPHMKKTEFKGVSQLPTSKSAPAKTKDSKTAGKPLKVTNIDSMLRPKAISKPKSNPSKTQSTVSPTKIETTKFDPQSAQYKKAKDVVAQREYHNPREVVPSKKFKEKKIKDEDSKRKAIARIVEHYAPEPAPRVKKTTSQKARVTHVDNYLATRPKSKATKSIKPLIKGVAKVVPLFGVAVTTVDANDESFAEKVINMFPFLSSKNLGDETMVDGYRREYLVAEDGLHKFLSLPLDEQTKIRNDDFLFNRRMNKIIPKVEQLSCPNSESEPLALKTAKAELAPETNYKFYSSQGKITATTIRPKISGLRARKPWDFYFENKDGSLSKVVYGRGRDFRKSDFLNTKGFDRAMQINTIDFFTMNRWNPELAKEAYFTHYHQSLLLGHSATKCCQDSKCINALTLGSRRLPAKTNLQKSAKTN